MKPNNAQSTENHIEPISRSLLPERYFDTEDGHRKIRMGSSSGYDLDQRSERNFQSGRRVSSRDEISRARTRQILVSLESTQKLI